MRREHPRRGRHRPPVVHHAPDPAQNVAADLEAVVSRETPPVEEQARQALLAVADENPPPALTPARIAKLEALTAQWVREVRVGGPGPDDTLAAGDELLFVAAPAREPQLAALLTPRAG